MDDSTLENAGLDPKFGFRWFSEIKLGNFQVPCSFGRIFRFHVVGGTLALALGVGLGGDDDVVLGEFSGSM